MKCSNERNVNMYISNIGVSLSLFINGTILYKWAPFAAAVVYVSMNSQYNSWNTFLLLLSELKVSVYVFFFSPSVFFLLVQYPGIKYKKHWTPFKSYSLATIQRNLALRDSTFSSQERKWKKNNSIPVIICWFNLTLLRECKKYYLSSSAVLSANLWLQKYVTSIDAVIVFALLSCGCKVTKSWQSKWNVFSQPVSNCIWSKLRQVAFTIQVLVRGLEELDYFKLITGEGWLLDLNLGKLSQVRSEILYFFLYGLQSGCSLSLRVTSCFLLVFKVRHRVQITANANWQGSQSMSVFFLFNVEFLRFIIF